MWYPAGGCCTIAAPRMTRSMPTLALRPRAHAARMESAAADARACTSGSSSLARLYTDTMSVVVSTDSARTAAAAAVAMSGTVGAASAAVKQEASAAIPTAMANDRLTAGTLGDPSREARPPPISTAGVVDASDTVETL